MNLVRLRPGLIIAARKMLNLLMELWNRRQVLECGRGLPHSKTLARVILATVLLLAFQKTALAKFALAKNGVAECYIIEQENASAPETNAVKELAETLRQITGAEFTVGAAAGDKDAAIIVGPGAFAQKYFPDIDLAKLGPDDLVMRVKGNKLLLAGGRPRGTIYAVNRFLQEQCGVRWWTPWATNIPRQVMLKVPDLNVTEKPAFEYRGPYWFPGFDPQWKVHNEANDESRVIPAELGGSIRYKGFCHTFYPLVPPEKYFDAHPEWYSLVNGRRTHDRAQLCLSNPQLRDFMVQRVKEWLREDPDAKIVSVTQNDNDGWCECPDCKALDDAEGSHAGTMITFANYIAEKIQPEFPNVWVDTFAYTYTRKPPKTVRPVPNVIVRLCSIECNFRQPLDHPSNVEFLKDLAAWSQICPHLYVWDYSTDFGHYIHPLPNWFTQGDNLRIFEKYGVKGIFSEGAYGGYGPEMGELRAWLLAQLMWNPQQDDRALIREFLEGYYGKAAAKPIAEYMKLFYDLSADYFKGCYMRNQPPYDRLEPLCKAELLWQEAERAAAQDPEKLERVRLAHLPVRYTWLANWHALRREWREENGVWPLSNSLPAVCDEFAKTCAGLPGEDWTHVNILSERGQTVGEFLAGVEKLPVDPITEQWPKRTAKPRRPDDVSRAAWLDCVDLQDNTASIYKAGEFAELRYDAQASDRRACWMPGTHREWAFRIPGKVFPARTFRGQWKIYVVARVEKSADAAPDATGFEAGVYDNHAHATVATCSPKLKDITEGYHSYLIGTFEPNSDRDVWAAPAGNKNVNAIYIDRVYLVPAK